MLIFQSQNRLSFYLHPDDSFVLYGTMFSGMDVFSSGASVLNRENIMIEIS